MHQPLYQPSYRPEPRHVTYADYLTWTTDRRYELYEGKPVMMPAPTDVHQEISMELATQLHTFLRGKKCRVYAAPFDVRLFESAGDRPENVDTVLQPDLSVICDKSKIDRRGCHGAPDMVIEILSKSTGRQDRRRKYALYQRAGVREYWIVDPDMRIVSVHTLEEGKYGSPVSYTERTSVPVGVLEGCEIDLSLVFPPEEA